jgi:anaphase-promoting complex subunit 6
MNMETFLRGWRQDALDRHQYDSAVYVGDKLLALTSMRSAMFPVVPLN